MFVISTFKHAIRIAPKDLGKDFKTALTEQIDRLFANYVIPDVGLCITFYDFKKIGASFILPGDGFTCTPVVFRYVLFQPFVGEIIEGTISRSSREGVFISMMFFQDIIVEPDKLPKVSKFDDNEQAWYWEYPNDGAVVKMFMEASKRVRFRVSSIHYENVEPGAENIVKAFSIKASFAESGLGCLSWWESNEQGPDTSGELVVD
ncbi:RNA polymerase III subunit rpc25 domain-containing protein [Ditylenchus destructor]|nr:RNA polymerase III subunit rpc25 domain-containing protein [Ditylenchus destructor]